MPPSPSIWHSPIDLVQLNAWGQSVMAGHLGIVITAVGDDFLEGTMPVDPRTHTPFGILHGGASVVLAETLGSVGGTLCIDQRTHHCVGLDINANHIRGVRGGRVVGVARPFHLGKTTHVWHIEIRDEQQRLVNVSRLTLAVIERLDR
ncbi:MAG: hotdog fold thioesterase [Rhodothermales bacterium]|nr:hotdog fold thioesterase [Rhodothermales bacterium]